MTNFCSLLFDAPLLQTSNILPQKSRFPFANASNRIFRKFPDAEFSVQWLYSPPFNINLCELITYDSFSLNYKLLEPQHFLFFMFEGDIIFTSPEGLYNSYVKSDHFGLIINDAAKIKVQLEKGRYTALSIALNSDWLSFFDEDQNLLKAYLPSVMQKQYILPTCRMEGKIKSWLKNLYTSFSRSKASLDGKLRFYIAQILETYLDQIDLKLKSIPYKIKTFIDNNYTQSEISLELIAKSLAISQSSIRSQFYTEFGCSPHHYYTSKRLSAAIHLLQNKKASLNDICHQIGYRDESSLRRALKRFGINFS